MIFAKDLYRSRDREFFSTLKHRDYWLTPKLASTLVATYWKSVFAICALCVLFGGVYAITAPPYFAADARILVDNADITSISKQMLSSSARTQATELQKPIGMATPEEIASTIELLKSEAIAGKVVDEMRLYDNAAFLQTHTSRWQRLALSFGLAAEKTKEENRQFAINQLADDLDVSRVGRSSVLVLRYTTYYAPLASDIVNTIARVYLLDRQSWRYETIIPLQASIDDKLKVLEEEAKQADITLQKYRADHKLLTVDGATVLDRQAQQVSSALVAARVDALGIDAKRDRFETAPEEQRPDKSVAEGRSTANWNFLLRSYTEARQLRDQISARAGPNHERVQSLDKTMEIYSSLMKDEREHVSGGVVSEGDIAKQRVAMLESLLASIRDSLYSSYEERSAADQLEILADAAHDRFTKLQDLSNRVKNLLTVPDNPARIISQATVPKRKDGPSIVPIVAIAGLIGMLFSFLYCVMHTWLTWHRLKSDSLGNLGLRNFGVITPPTAAASDQIVAFPEDESSILTLHQLQLDLAERIKASGSLVFGLIPCRTQVELSPFYATIAEMFARQGKRVIVLDVAYAVDSLKQDRREWHDVQDMIVTQDTIDRSVKVDATSGVSTLKIIGASHSPSGRPILRYKDIHQLTDLLRQSYDCIILNAPQPGNAFDLSLATKLLNCYVFVLPDRGISFLGAQRLLTRIGLNAAKCMGGMLVTLDHRIFAVRRLNQYKGA